MAHPERNRLEIIQPRGPMLGAGSSQAGNSKSRRSKVGAQSKALNAISPVIYIAKPMILFIITIPPPSVVYMHSKIAAGPIQLMRCYGFRCQHINLWANFYPQGTRKAAHHATKAVILTL